MKILVPVKTLLKKCLAKPTKIKLKLLSRCKYVNLPTYHQEKNKFYQHLNEIRLLFSE